MSDSIFTKIINGEVPCHKVYEDDTVLAFLDIHPSAPGHTLVVPKIQIDPIWSLDDDTYQKVMAAVKKLALHIKNVLGAPFVGIKIEGVAVPHAHVHLIPFSTPAEFAQTGDTNAEPNHAALAEMASRLTTA